MGIPSYYKKLLDVLPTLIQRSHPDAGIQWLFMDFNCLIYHCLPRCPEYPGDSQKDEWESQFIACIVEYCLKVIRKVSPQTGVYIAIDGVVPMAKMRQQRLRRFKSVWLRSEDPNAGPKWDTNAITPGTTFMKKLHAGLEGMIRKKGKGTWHLSSSDEPGEGEHKLMNAWRTGSYTGNFAVYGLDADLIVLSLLGQETCSLDNKIWLFREEIDKGKIAYDAEGEEQFEWFSIHALRDWIVGSLDRRQTILNYCFAMSVLGNDFLHSSLGLKIRDDGHGELLSFIQLLRVPLVYPNTMEISQEGLQFLFTHLTQSESNRIEKSISKKQMFARNLGVKDLPLGHSDWPLLHMDEDALLEHGSRHLCSTWKQKYLTQFFSGHSRSAIVKEYLYGIQWIWAYYTGSMDQICFNWYYPYSLPPLWEWVRDSMIQGDLPEFPEKIWVRATDIRPVEQLALVLPLESWSLIPPCKERSFPAMAPQFYPRVFGFESAGKRFFWECESNIPLPSIRELKAIMID